MNSLSNLPRLGWSLHATGLCSTLGVAALLYLFLLTPMQKETASLAAQANEKLECLRQAEAFVSTHDNLQQQLDREEIHLDQLLARIPSVPQESVFLGQLARLARESDVSIHQFSRDSTTHEETHSKMDVKLSAHASYQSICRFLAGLTELRRLCVVRDLKISQSVGNSEGYPVEITLRIFFAPLRETVTNHMIPLVAEGAHHV
ncbi:MAG: type 4a pilus biogenesis protein PilO [Pirellulales bacterium]|nr:type 4a pilus biogenesis protein PilO [Pirellulales bacterium]